MSNLHDQVDGRLPIHYTHYQQQPQPQQQQQQQQLVQNDQESDMDKYRRYFYNRAQEQTETAEEFLSELERLSQGARFDLEMPHNVVEKLLRDR